MNTITIAPLSTPCCITLAAHEAIMGADRLFLQTRSHPSSKWICERGLDYTAMDDLYESCEDFDLLNEAIAARLMCGADAVYAVPGRGAGSAQLEAIRTAAVSCGARIRVLPGSGYAEAAAAAAGEPLSGALVCAANQLPEEVDPHIPLYIEELDTPLRAGEVKLRLSEYFPDEHPVWFCPADDEGCYSPIRIPLYELDRQSGYFAATCCLVPRAEADRLTRGGAVELMALMRRLRAPGGCPWDREQTHASIKSSLIEEAYEVIDAIDREDDDALCEELGDLLLQVVFHAAMAEETGAFSFRDVSTGIINKLIYRHPHIFSDASAAGAEDVRGLWEQLKRREKHQLTYADSMRSVPRGFPALMRSAKVQKKAANIGFDWDSAMEAFIKLPEEFHELEQAISEGEPASIDDELGDLFFALVNVARLLRRDAEELLHRSTDKFMARFECMERLILEERGSLNGMPLSEMDKYWERAKAKNPKS